MDWAISRENVESAAYALGAFTGDGWSQPYVNYGNGGWYTVGISCMDYEIVKGWQQDVETVFGKSYKICPYIIKKSGTQMFTCSSKSRVVYNFFNDLTVFKRQVPEAIAKSDNFKAVSRYIAGLFDTDGSVSHNHTGRFQLKLGLTELRVIEEVASMLQRYGVKVGEIGTETKGGYRTIFRITPNIRSFIESGFFFNCLRKAERLSEYQAKVAA